MAPQRIQLRRTRGWRLPPNAANVARPSKWGNPFKVADHGREAAVRLFQQRLEQMRTDGSLDLSTLRGKDLACWCKAGEVCHADVLLKMANE